MIDTRGSLTALMYPVIAAIPVLLLALPDDTGAADFDETVRTARQYLKCSDRKERAALSQELAGFTDDWRDVVEALRPRPTQAAKSGYYREEHFTDPRLRQKRPDDLLYLVVPTSYQPGQPTGLVVFMHGGGKGSVRTAPDRYMTPADSTTPQSSSRLGDIFEALGMIGVGPSAPWNENDHSRWCLPEADDYNNRWVTLDAANEAPLEYDALQVQGPGHSKDSTPEEWKQWKLTHTSVKRDGAMIEAVNLGENRLKVTATNVSRFTLWLHPTMVDFGRPVQVAVNGEPRFDARVVPSLVTAIESFERRRDWGLVYPAKITIHTTGNRRGRLPE